MLFGKPLEYWAVLIGGALYVATRNAESEVLARRLVKTAMSAFLAYGLSPTISPWTSGSEVLAALVIFAFAELVLDVITGLISDREFIKGIIKKRMGGNDG